MNVSIFRNERDLRTYEAGAIIFAEGDAPDAMYAVVEGEVAIEIGGQVVETAGPGTIFGEMALIDGSPRSGRAVASVACTLARIDERRFLFLVQQTPNFAVQVMRMLAHRLRRWGSHANA